MNAESTDADLHWLHESLSVIRDRSLLEGTCYFEFAVSDSPSQPKCWSDGSLFISDTGFDFIHAAFMRADPDFDYYSFNRFDPQGVVKLLSKLLEWESEVVNSQDCGILEQTFPHSFSFDYWSRFPWEHLRTQIVHASQEIRGFIARHQNPETFLWVLGM
jgi:hypothetical protein